MRFLIDCCHINFAKVPTGIPRVVFSYIDVGHDWGARNQADIIPVIATGKGLFLVRPAPSQNAPAALKRLAATDSLDKALIAAHDLCGKAYAYFKDVVHHGLLLIASLVRFRMVRRIADRLDSMFAEMAIRPQRALADKIISRVKVDVEPGDVLFAPAFWYDNDPEIYRSLRQKGVRIVHLVHDILPITHPQYYEAPARDMHRAALEAAFHYVDAFVCISECTRAALQDFGARNNLPITPMVTVYNGFDGLAAPTASEDAYAVRKDLGRLFEAELKPLIMVGTIEPKKGHVRVVEAMEKLWSAGYERPLVIIGRRGWLYEPTVRAINASKFYGAKLHWFSDITDLDLVYAYSRCHALVFASIAEGFGIPMVEASTFRKPTLALRTEISQEILGAYGVYFDDSDNAFSKVLLSLERSEQYSMAVERLATFDWPTSKETVPRAYAAIARLLSSEGVVASLVPAALRARSASEGVARGYRRAAAADEHDHV